MVRVSKEQRVQRAQEIMRQNPDWGKGRISKELRAEFGVSLRDSHIVHMKAGLLSSEVRAQRARQLIAQNPIWGRPRIDRALRQEFGRGLRHDAIHRLKTEVLYAKPSRVERRYQALRKEGWLPTEARALSQNPITSPAMTKYRAERRHEVREGRRMGLSQKAITERIRIEYKFEGHWEKGKIQPLIRYRAFLKEKKLPPEAERVLPRIRKAALPPGVEWKAPTYLSYDQVRIYDALVKAGFLPFEGVRIAGADSMPAAWNTAPVQAAVQHRKEWVAWLRSRGWTDQEIRREINRYYQKDPKKRDPWDWIKKEYQPRLKIKDFTMAMGRRKQGMRARGRTRALYGARRRRLQEEAKRV